MHSYLAPHGPPGEARRFGTYSQHNVFGGGFAVKFRVLLEPDEDGVYVAEVPALPGYISQGRTREEAITNIEESVAAYLESLNAHGDPIPPPISDTRAR